MRARTLAATVAALLLATTATAQAAITTGTRIMPLGASITYGFVYGQSGCTSTTTGGYRTGLFTRFTSAGITPDFVGSKASGPAGIDPDHEGWCGLRIDEIATGSDVHLDATLAAKAPDVILLHVGTNDMYQDDAGFPAATAPGRLSALIDQIVAARPTATLYVASLVPSNQGPINDRIVAFSRTIAGIVRDKANPKVVYVDQHDAVRTNQLSDWIHPNPDGYEAMARTWHAALTGTPPDLILGSGFEDQLTGALASPWSPESSVAGSASFGTDRGLGVSRTGPNNGWIATSGTGWNAMTQTIAVQPNRTYRLSAWVQNSQNFTGGWVSVRTPSGTLLGHRQHGAAATYQEEPVTFATGTATSVVVRVGYWGPGASSWERVDDVTLVAAG